MNRSKQLDQLLYFLYIVFFISMICCFRAVSSITTGIIVLTGLIKNNVEPGSLSNRRFKNPVLLACCLFYVLQIAALFYTKNYYEELKSLQTKSAMIFVPLAACSCNWLNAQVREKLMKYFIWILVAVLLYCLFFASYKYLFAHQKNEVFFYHTLVSPFQQHAVQVSIYVFVALIYLLETAKKNINFYNKPVHGFLIFYFICCILLLSSKLVISFSGVCLLYYLLLLMKAKTNNRFIVYLSLVVGFIVTGFVFSTQNKISKRFTEIISGDVSIIEQKDFSPAIYFNGLQFRLLQWRFVNEILTEQHAWIKGVSDNAQKLLDEKYISTHMYTGDGTSGSNGYLSYNTHNQFLQSLLESGIGGLFFFILICSAMVYLAIRRKSRELTIVVILLITYCFNEAVCETQYGLMLFTFFPMFLYYGTVQQSR